MYEVVIYVYHNVFNFLLRQKGALVLRANKILACYSVAQAISLLYNERKQVCLQFCLASVVQYFYLLIDIYCQLCSFLLVFLY